MKQPPKHCGLAWMSVCLLGVIKSSKNSWVENMQQVMSFLDVNLLLERLKLKHQKIQGKHAMPSWVWWYSYCKQTRIKMSGMFKVHRDQNGSCGIFEMMQTIEDV